MAKAKIIKSAPRAKKLLPNSPQEVKVVVELHIPQLNTPRALSSLSNSPISLFATSAEREKEGTLTIKPVQDIHIVEIEINTISFAKDENVQKDQNFTATQNIFPTRPLSLFLHITGIPNTMISINFDLDSKNEFKGDLFIPNSGRLVIQKIIP